MSVLEVILLLREEVSMFKQKLLRRIFGDRDPP